MKAPLLILVLLVAGCAQIPDCPEQGDPYPPCDVTEYTVYTNPGVNTAAVKEAIKEWNSCGFVNIQLGTGEYHGRPGEIEVSNVSPDDVGATCGNGADVGCTTPYFPSWSSKIVYTHSTSSDEANDQTTITHEFGHALGGWHIGMQQPGGYGIMCATEYNRALLEVRPVDCDNLNYQRTTGTSPPIRDAGE